MNAIRLDILKHITKVSWVVVLVSVSMSFLIFTLHGTLSGPGDQIGYFDQARQLIPFEHPFYGPTHFVMLRVIHDLTGYDWFEASKLLSWLCSLGFLLIARSLLLRELGPTHGTLALVIVAFNPYFLVYSSQEYTYFTTGFWIILSLWLTRSLQRNQWIILLAGFCMALACLGRMQSVGFALGAWVGLLLEPGPLRSRFVRACFFLLGMTAPIVAWTTFLNVVQGGPPPTQTQVTLAYALEDIKEIRDYPEIVKKYPTYWSVLGSSPSAPFKIAFFGVKRAWKYPRETGYALLFVTSYFLPVGLLVWLARRESWNSLSCGFLFGFYATSFAHGSNWPFYSIPLLPLIAVAIAWLPSRLPSRESSVVWLVLILSTLAYGSIKTVSVFNAVEWTEIQSVHDCLRREKPGSVLVSASSVGYGQDWKTVSMNSVLAYDTDYSEPQTLARSLLESGVDYIVILEAHTLFDFPSLAIWLEADPPDSGGCLDRILWINDRPTGNRAAVLRVNRDPLLSR